jgi:GTP-binding protein
MFIDEADIRVRGGDGGNGCVSFRREAHIPHGGPDGGDGGRGGSVIMVADPSVDTLLDFKGRPEWTAESGRPGSDKRSSGRSGKDRVVRVPVGTIVTDLDRAVVLKDLAEPNEEFIVARGGRGGLGNCQFTSPVRQAPDFATPGRKGQERRLHLELKLIADVGLLGLPNAGKSTLLVCLSAATPKIASYPFTTTEPCLGIVEAGRGRRFVMADLPGLIAGAHAGVGLGDRFLRHVERTRVLVHLVEPEPLDGSDPAENYRVIRREITLYSAALARRPELVVMSKMDLTGAELARRKLEVEIGRPVLGLSGVAHKGLRRFVSRLVAVLDEEQAARAFDSPDGPADSPDDAESSADQETSDHVPETSD